MVREVSFHHLAEICEWVNLMGLVEVAALTPIYATFYFVVHYSFNIQYLIVCIGCIFFRIFQCILNKFYKYKRAKLSISFVGHYRIRVKYPSKLDSPVHQKLNQPWKVNRKIFNIIKSLGKHNIVGCWHGIVHVKGKKNKLAMHFWTEGFKRLDSE